MKVEPTPTAEDHVSKLVARETRFGGIALQGAALLTGLGALIGVIVGGKFQLTPVEYWSAVLFLPFAAFIFVYARLYPKRSVEKLGVPTSVITWIYVVINTWSVAGFASEPANILIHLAWGTPLSIFFFIVLSRRIALILSIAATFMQGLALVYFVNRPGLAIPVSFLPVFGIWSLTQCVSIALIFGVNRLLESNLIEYSTVQARLESAEKEYALLKQIREERNRYRRLIDASLDIVAELKPDGTLVEISKNCVELTGFTRDELIGTPLQELVSDEFADTAFSALSNVIAGKPSSAIEQEIIAKDGRCVPILVSAVYSPQDEIIFVIIRDLTERIKQEERERHASRLEALGQLTGGIAHDFNNLLTVMYGEVERIESIVEKNDIKGIDMSRLIRATDGAVDLTRRLLTFSRKDPLYLTRTNLKVTIERTIELIASSIGKDYNIVAFTEDLWARVDIQELQAAIINLAINARDATPAGGTINVNVKARHLAQSLDLPWGSIKAGDYAVIEIRDHGTGIPADMIASVVEPYFSTKGQGQGTGLGLSMALQLAEKLGGGLAIESEMGKGTSVSLYIPQDHQVEPPKVHITSETNT
ncbi:MAG: ATP-binding protein [Parvibaculum sp.]|nr:ATP-binding protein [Parvibaculum sp.]